MWNEGALHDLIESRLHDYQLIVVANREPYIHCCIGKRIECMFPASGIATALDPVMRACGGVWIGHGSGNADRETVDSRDHVRVPPDEPRYTLRRVWLTKEQELGYYYGLANGALWPLCHITFTRPKFDSADWRCYRDVNELFCRAVLEEAGNKPTFVFIQDYHFALLPRLLKNANSKLIVAQFWHIPWPNREIFRAFPWKEELLDGLLGNDLLGFHIRNHCQNFLDTVDRGLEAKVDQELAEVTRGGHVTVVRPFPISIDFEGHQAIAGSARVDSYVDGWRIRLGLQDELVGIGIDRIDYTKGIPERFRAIDRFLEKNPGYRKKLVFVQVGVPSRSHIPQYMLLNDELDKLTEEINWKWSEGSWRPLILLKEHYAQPELMALHRLARFCIVSSLHDGLNLVAKEFVSSRFDGEGVLIFSQFTGAARELTDAVLVNPFAVDEIAEAVRKAVDMPEAEQRRRMKRMRDTVANNNVFRWAGKIISTLLRFEFPEQNGAAFEASANMGPTEEIPA